MRKLRFLLEALVVPSLLTFMLVAKPTYAQQPAPASGPQVQMTVGVEAKHGNDVPALKQSDVKAFQGHDQDNITSWVPAQGDRAGLELAILLDDSSSLGLASQLNDIRAFINAQPPSTLIAVGYMQNGTVALTQNFTAEHAAAAKALRMPMGIQTAGASPFFSLSDLVKRWPMDPRLPRREVLMISAGIDVYYGPGPADPYVDSTVADAQRAGVIVYAIYTPGAGHFGHSYWRNYWGQNYLAQVAEETGGESYYNTVGSFTAVAFAPFLNELATQLQHQYVTTFVPKPEKKAGLQKVRFTTEVQNADIVAADKVFVPATPGQ